MHDTLQTERVAETEAHVEANRGFFLLDCQSVERPTSSDWLKKSQRTARRWSTSFGRLAWTLNTHI